MSPFEDLRVASGHSCPRFRSRFRASPLPVSSQDKHSTGPFVSSFPTRPHRSHHTWTPAMARQWHRCGKQAPVAMEWKLSKFCLWPHHEASWTHHSFLANPRSSGRSPTNALAWERERVQTQKDFLAAAVKPQRRGAPLDSAPQCPDSQCRRWGFCFRWLLPCFFICIAHCIGLPCSKWMQFYSKSLQRPRGQQPDTHHVAPGLEAPWDLAFCCERSQWARLPAVPPARDSLVVIKPKASGIVLILFLNNKTWYVFIHVHTCSIALICCVFVQSFHSAIALRCFTCLNLVGLISQVNTSHFRLWRISRGRCHRGAPGSFGATRTLSRALPWTGTFRTRRARARLFAYKKCTQNALDVVVTELLEVENEIDLETQKELISWVCERFRKESTWGKS